MRISSNKYWNRQWTVSHNLCWGCVTIPSQAAQIDDAHTHTHTWTSTTPHLIETLTWSNWIQPVIVHCSYASITVCDQVFEDCSHHVFAHQTTSSCETSLDHHSAFARSWKMWNFLGCFPEDPSNFNIVISAFLWKKRNHNSNPSIEIILWIVRASSFSWTFSWFDSRYKHEPPNVPHTFSLGTKNE